MASKLELRFTGSGQAYQQVFIDNSGFTFLATRQAAFQVKTKAQDGSDLSPNSLATEFFYAFQADKNYLNEFTVNRSSTNLDASGNVIPNGGYHGIVTIEHTDNTKFNNFANDTTFINHTITTTSQEVKPTLTIGISASTVDVCGRFGLSIDSNQTEGNVIVELPEGNVISEFPVSSLPETMDLARASTERGGVVKIFGSVANSQIIISKKFLTPALTVISTVEITGSPYGASAKIISMQAAEYSLNGVDWKTTNSFPSLTEGSYTAYVKDLYGCTKTKTFEVTAEDVSGITIPGQIHFPIHNSIRMFQNNGNTFLNLISFKTPGITPLRNYEQDYQTGQSVTQQFKSSYKNHTAKIHDCEGNETEIVIEKKTNHISKVNIYEGNYKNYEGYLAVYFTAGDIFNPDGSRQDFGHNLNGNLPKWYKANVFLNIEGAGVTKIDRVYFDREEEVTYAITEMEYTSSATNVEITSIHTENPYEIYEFDVNFFQEGKYMLSVDYGDGVFYSEIIKVHAELPKRYFNIGWYSEDNNDIIYNTGIKQLRNIPYVKYFTYISTNEKEVFKADTIVTLVNSKSYATYEVAFRPMPMEIARGLDYGFNNSTHIDINGALFVCDGEFSVEPLGSLYKVTAQLTLIGESMQGQQGNVNTLIDSFLIVEENANGVAFLKL